MYVYACSARRSPSALDTVVMTCSTSTNVLVRITSTGASTSLRTLRNREEGVIDTLLNMSAPSRYPHGGRSSLMPTAAHARHELDGLIPSEKCSFDVLASNGIDPICRNTVVVSHVV